MYLKATQPDLEITDPYRLTEEQFNAAVDLLKQQRPDIGKYWDGTTYATTVTTFKSGETTVGTTWPLSGQPHGGREAAVSVTAIKPEEGTTGWSDTWMISQRPPTRTACTCG